MPPPRDSWEIDINPPPSTSPYQLLHELAIGQARIEGMLTPLVSASADHETRLRKLEDAGIIEHGQKIKDLTDLVDSLQRWRWILTGAAAATGSGGGALVATLLQR